MKVPIEISAHHCHISQQDLDILFGKNYKLRPIKELSQTGQYACQEVVLVQTKAGKIDTVRILGPVRKNTQIEISRTEAFKLEIDPPVQECTQPGKIGGCAPVEIIGPKGKISRCAAIIAHRHIHTDPKTAKKLGLKNRQLVSVKVPGKRGLIFNNVLIRIDKDFVWRMHLDTDEANAAEIKPGTKGILII